MRTISRTVRLGGLAVGLGIGAALAAVPGTASADTWPPPFDPNDFAISIDGYTLFHDGTATATSGPGDIAIADGAGSNAVAGGNSLNFAYADGTNASAYSGGGNGYFDNAIGIGDSNSAEAANGDFDSASALGNDVTASAVDGNYDSASSFGATATALAGFGSGDAATYWGSYGEAQATGGNDDIASVINTGDAIDNALAGSNNFTIAGNDDIATIFGTGSLADSGADATTPGDFDLAAVFGDSLNALATGGNFLTDILP
jgi:hypothetical protein